MRSFVNWGKRGPWIALAVLGAAALVLVAARVRERRRFEGAVGSAEAHLLARFERQAVAVRTLAAWPIATAAEFAAAVAALPDRGPPALGFARSFRRGETGEIENALQQQGFAGLRVWPDSGREGRTAVVWLLPLRRGAIGYDMLADPVRRDALERARDSGAPALSGRTTLEEAGPGFLLCAPVYRGGSMPATLEGRRAQLLGWTFRAVREDDFFKALLGPEPVEMNLDDGDDAPPRSGRAAFRPGRLEEKRRIVLGGRAWTIRFSPPLP